MYVDEHIGRKTTEKQILKKNEKVPQDTVDIPCSQRPRLCLPLTLFRSEFDKVHDLSQVGQHFAEHDWNQ